MRNKDIWSDAGELDVERLGLCHAYHRTVQSKYHQWKIKHGFVEVVGDFSYDKTKALDNAFKELKKKFKSIFKTMIALAILLALIGESYNSLTK